MIILAKVLDVLPITLSGSSGGEWKAGLAWALIGGLTSSLLLTLLIVPLVYSKTKELRISIPAFAKKLVQRKQISGELIIEPEVVRVRLDD